MRRTYKQVGVLARGTGFTIVLDGKPLRTAAGTPVVVPTRALAMAIADEWAKQGENLRLSAVPLTRLVSTVLDRLPAARDAVRTELAAYAETELLCHRAERPPALVQRQQSTWQPLLDWLAQRFGAPLAVTHGVIAHRQPTEALAALRRALEAYDDWRLAALALSVGAAGSLVIGLALIERRIEPGAAFAAAELDASFQMEAWGEDAEATRRRAQVREDLEVAARFISLADAAQTQ